MKRKAAMLGLALLIAAPGWAQRGGGHGAGFSAAARGGGAASRGSGGHPAGTAHTAAPAHIAAAHTVTAPLPASASRPAASGFTASHFVPRPATPTRSDVRHLPIGTLTSRPVPPLPPSHVRLTWTTASAQPQHATTRMPRLTPAQPGLRLAPMPARALPVRNPTLLAVNLPVRRSAAFIFVGDGFFFPFFFETITCDPFLVNAFCPVCTTGRIPRFNVVSPFVRRFFFNGFFPGGFFPAFGPAFGTNVFLSGEPEIAAPAEEAPAGEEKPSEAGMPAEEAAPSSSGAEQPGARPITLLFLKNGWMGSLTDYWVEDGRLHYVTSYGGEDSVPLAQIDFDRTVRLNAERGVEFVLRPGPRSR